MSSDTIELLGKLVRTGLWSRRNGIAKFKRFVVDVDSLVTFLYRLCISDHIKKLKKSSPNANLDLNSATLVNYVQYSNHVKRFLDLFAKQQVDLHLVYQGKFMEAPLFGLLAAQFKRNTQRVRDALLIIKENSKSKSTNIIDAPKQMSRPNLALNIFKLIINERLRSKPSAKTAKLFTYQAFYSSYPLMTKLARDLRCPVITNNGDFILMDVRCGFILMDELWSARIDSIASSSSSSPPKTKSVSSVSFNSDQRRSSTSGELDFHYNVLFLRQHPGLTNQLSVRLYPLTTIDFVVTHSESLKRLGVYDAIYKDEDFFTKGYKVLSSSGARSDKKAFKQHHKAAERLEFALRFCCGKTVSLLGNLIRSEATRANSSIDDDFLFILQNYMVAFGFKERLRFVLKYLDDPLQLNFIESLLKQRECTADFLLDILACSVGHLASVNYNRFMQFEDLTTKRSAHSLLDGGKSALMSLFSENKSHKSEHSKSMSSKRPDTVTRYADANLTIVDRQGDRLVERTIDTISSDPAVNTLRDKLQLYQLASNSSSLEDRVKFICQVFQTPNLTKLDAKMAKVAKELIPDDELRTELAILSSLFKFAFSEAQRGDSNFKKTYSKLINLFEVAILYAHVHLGGKADRQRKLKATIEKENFENIAAFGGGGSADATIGSIRHLIELLGASLETFLELNAFLNYPVQNLKLHLHYNPILLFNLTLYLHKHSDPGWNLPRY